MKIRPIHRQKLRYYLKEFYKRYPNERYTIFHYVKAMRKRLKDNKDAWNGVSGDTGVGKSYFVMMTQILFGRPTNLVDNICYIPKGNEITEKLDKLTFNVLLIDEAAKEMRSVNWHSKPQQKVNIHAMTERYKNNAIYLNMPNFDEFTKSMRRGSLLFRIVIPYRTEKYARIIIQRKSRNFRSDDPWGDKLANKKYENIEKKKKEITNEKILEIERSLPNTVMDFIIPNLELILPEITDEYKRLKIASREIEKESDPQEQRNVYKEKYETLLNKTTKILYYNELDIGKGVRVTKGEISMALGITTITFNKFLTMEKPQKKITRR